MYYTKNKSENKNPELNNRPYFITAETKDAITDQYPSNVVFYAVDAESEKKLGRCSISKKGSSTGVSINTLELFDHAFDHCGIGSTLLNIAENYAYQKLHSNYATLLCSPDKGYEEAVSNLYYFKAGYAKFTALNHLMKDLKQETLMEMLDIDDIDFSHVDQYYQAPEQQ